MRKQILDTNVLLRFLVGDVPGEQKQAEAWFHEAKSGRLAIVVSPIVIAEASFVLESFYKHKRESIASALELFVSQRWLKVESRRELVSLWKWYRKGLHFVDSFLLAWADRYGGDVLTFDKQVARK